MGTLATPEGELFIQHNLTMFFDLNLIRRDPALLNDSGIMRYFILVNNCLTGGTSRGVFNDDVIRKMAKNELRYPEMVGFYKPKVAELLSSVPTTTTVTMAQADLGEYDGARKAFPVITVRISGAVVREGNRGTPSKRVDLYKQSPVPATTLINNNPGYPSGGACTDAMAARTIAQKTARSMGDVYVFNIAKGLSFDEVPMDLAAARKYLDSTPGNRQVRFDAQLELADLGEPIVKKPCPDGSGLTCIEFPAKLKTIQVIKASNAGQIGWGKITPDQVLATLYP